MTTKSNDTTKTTDEGKNEEKAKETEMDSEKQGLVKTEGSQDLVTISIPDEKIEEILECGVGGKNPEEQLNFAIEMLGKEVSAKEIMDDGEYVDSIAVTKGKGFQGPVKRWGIRIQYGKAARSSKARHVGSIGPWTPSRTMWTVAQAGQMGYHKRTEYNKKILKIAEASEADAVNPAGGSGSHTSSW